MGRGRRGRCAATCWTGGADANVTMTGNSARAARGHALASVHGACCSQGLGAVAAVGAGRPLGGGLPTLSLPGGGGRTVQGTPRDAGPRGERRARAQLSVPRGLPVRSRPPRRRRHLLGGVRGGVGVGRQPLVEKNVLETCVIELQGASPLSQRHAHTRDPGRHLRGCRGHSLSARVPCARPRGWAASVRRPQHQVSTNRAVPGDVPRGCLATRRGLRADARPSPASSPSPAAPTTLSAGSPRHACSSAYLLLKKNIYIYFKKPKCNGDRLTPA